VSKPFRHRRYGTLIDLKTVFHMFVRARETVSKRISLSRLRRRLARDGTARGIDSVSAETKENTMRRRKPLYASPKVSFLLGLCSFTVLPSSVVAQVGSNVPDEDSLVKQRQTEVSSGFVVEPPDQPLRPAERLRRNTYGDVGLAPLSKAEQLERLLFPSVPQSAREKVVEGASFFTTPHTATEGAGPAANQTRCAGCHLNNLESVPGAGLLMGTSNVSRAGRSTPTNFSFTSGDTANGGR
jgi:hypothetical protein